MSNAIEVIKKMNKSDVQDRLKGKISYEDKMELFKQDFEAFRREEITWSKLQETVSGLLQLYTI